MKRKMSKSLYLSVLNALIMRLSARKSYKQKTFILVFFQVDIF